MRSFVPASFFLLCLSLTMNNQRSHAGFAWGRHRQVRTPPSSLSLQDYSVTTSLALEAVEPLEDDDVDCDMIANTSNDGISIGAVPEGPVGWKIRRRAVMEKGIRTGFHGGWVRLLSSPLSL